MNTTKSVLLVDDDEDIVDFLNGFFGDKYSIFQAYDGKEALKKFESETPNLVVTDIKIPEINGLELIKEIRKISGTKIIAISGGGDAGLNEAKKLGADYILRKPLEMPELLELVKKLLG